MRVFYIIFFFSTLLSFASFAASKKNTAVKSHSTQITTFSKRYNLKFNFGIAADQENIQKDLINSTLVKILLDLFAVLLIIMLLSLPLKIGDSILKRLKYNYWCLLEMLYPKHVFW